MAAVNLELVDMIKQIEYRLSMAKSASTNTEDWIICGGVDTDGMTYQEWIDEAIGDAHDLALNVL